MMSNRKLALLLVAIVVALSSAIIMLPRFKNNSVPMRLAQTLAPAETNAPHSEQVVIAKAAAAETKHASAGRAKITRLETAKGRQARRASAEDRDGDEAGNELVLRRNGTDIRVKQEQEHRPGERFDQPAEAMRWYLQKRLPKGEKELPVERYFTALDQMKNQATFSTTLNEMRPQEANANDSNVPAAPPFTWTNLGPGNVGGRTRSLIIDPNNVNIMYAGAVDGGIWKSTNAGASWAPQDDFMANIAVTCMAIDTTNTQILYAGTGEGFFNVDRVRGAGIFKTINGGTTWTRLAATNTSDFFFVTDVVVSPANPLHLYASTSTGVQRSLDGGATWTLVLAASAANGANGAMDLVMRSDATGQANDYIFAAVGTFAQSHIWRNTDAGGVGVWTDVYTEAAMGRTSLAIAPSNQSIIYAMAAQQGAGSNASYTDGLLAVFRNAANGDAGSWITQVRNNSVNKQDTLLLSNPIFGAGGATECNIGGVQFINQGWYHNQLAVDPTDATKVWVAGTDMWRSDNSGVNWGVASYWWFQGNGVPPANGDPQLAHADNHIIVFKPGYNGTSNQTMYVGDDGGIYRTDNAFAGDVGYVTGTTPTGGTITSTSPICGTPVTSPISWTPLNNSYQVTQFYEGLPYPNGTTYFGGTQDNGTNRGTDAAGANGWERIFGGDGGYVAVDSANTQNLYAETTGLSFKRSTDGGVNFLTRTGGISGDVFPFITTFIMDPSNVNRIWIGGRFMWRTDTASTMPSGSGWILASQSLTGGSLTSIAVSPSNANRVLAGTASGRVNSTTTGTTATSATVWTQNFTPRGNGNGTISWLTFHPTNDLIAYATISNFNGTANANGTNSGHVFKSIDGGVNWTLLDGTGANTIPDIPAHSVVVVPNNPNRIYVGTDLGVFVSLDAGANWFKETGFPNVVTESLAVNTVGLQTSIYAFTHGRSAYRALITPTAAPASISGQITTADGAPLAGVTMNLSGARSARAITDSSGNYRFTNIDTDNFYTITPALTNYHFGPESRSFSLLANMTDAVFTATRDTVIGGNAIDSAGFFVRQHYLDFLGREPDESGFNFWSDQILSCGNDTACVERRTINVSAAYFLSIEFQQTGGLVDGLYRASYGRRPQFAEFMPDTGTVARNVVVGHADWAQTLEANKQAFVAAWVQRADFRAAYDGLSNAAFVDTLIAHAGAGFNGDRAALVSGLNGGTLTRAAVLRQVVENEGFVAAKRNETFVMMQYFGYLRRDPDAAGYQFWLNKLNQFNGNFEQAEMVKAFIVSGEYRDRFR